MQYLDLTPGQVADAWLDLRAHVRQHEDVLNVAGLGARLGWSRTAAKALLNPGEGSARTASTLERLAQAQHLLAGFGYLASRPAYYTPVMGAAPRPRALELDLQLRALEAEYLRLAPDHIQARAIAEEFSASRTYAARAEEIARHLEGLLADILIARRALRLLPLQEEPPL